MDFLYMLLLFAVGSIAGLINVMAGGGSALTLPALIFLGLDSALANGTNRIAIFIQNIFAVASFRQQQVHQFENSFKLSLWTLPGSVIGAVVAVNISNVWFERILAIVLIGVIISMIFPPTKNTAVSKSDGNYRHWLIYPALLGIGFYGGFIQVGVGFLFMASLFHLLRIDLVLVNMHKVFIVLIYTIPVLAIFILSDNVDWAAGLSLAAGNSFGAWWSARISVKKGDKVIRYVLFVAIFIM
ncbi:TSUP family transporter, partial [Candidatus Saccharibacteria bacterium]|nr:TSUP family transporter [Candidatus Saccharibacteria bacterium]NIW79826.1 TSUP family transporter [Calditrichia bacterium]